MAVLQSWTYESINRTYFVSDAAQGRGYELVTAVASAPPGGNLVLALGADLAPGFSVGFGDRCRDFLSVFARPGVGPSDGALGMHAG
jgi:hypothetical protein